MAIIKYVLPIACLIAFAAGSHNDLPDSKRNGYAVEGGCRRDWDVDYLDLAITWGPGACISQRMPCKRNIENKFTIHGLWPQHDKHSTPVDCCTKNIWFDFGDVTKVKNLLRQHWPTLIDSYKDDYYFWKHEWEKHGSCAIRTRGVSTVPEYFEFAVKSFAALNLKAILEKDGFYPSQNNFYFGKDIAAALSRGIGARVKVDCLSSKKDPSVLVLNQIHVCYDTQLRLTDCKINTTKLCRQKIRFPSA